MTKAAKGKQFIVDYDLLSYKIIFQLANKQGNTILISHIQCETNTINERKYILLKHSKLINLYILIN